MSSTYSSTSATGTGKILIALTPRHQRTINYTRTLPNSFAKKFPAEVFFFQAADITSQILNFGLPAPIDVQVAGNDLAQNSQIALKLQNEIAGLPGAVDVFVRQHPDYPTADGNVDRILPDEA